MKACRGQMVFLCGRWTRLFFGRVAPITGDRDVYVQPEATRRALRLTGADFGASPPTAVSRQPMTDESSGLLAGRNILRRVLSQRGEQE